MSTAATAQPGTWITVGVLIGMALTLLVGILVGAAWRARRSRRTADRPSPALADPPPTDPEPAAPAFAVDDLPGFLDRPPGWAAGPAVLPAAAPADRTTSPTTGSTAAHPGAADSTAADSTGANPSEEAAGRHSAPRSTTAAPVGGDLGRGGTLGIGASVLLIIAAVVVAFAGDGSGASATPVGAGTDVTAPPRSATPGTGSATPTTQGGGAAASSAAGDLAMISVPLGEDGVAASVTFQGVILEERAVGLTVTYPSVSVSTDGRRSLAHVRLPTFNCLTGEPPADPVAAGCARSLTEYADLASPALQVSRDGGRLDVLGLFPTYTRSNGSAPAYTGRAYQLTAAITADGPERKGRAPAAGVLRIGLDSAPTTADRGVNLLQLPG